MPETRRDKLGVGIVGAGWIGQVHGRAWQANSSRARIVAVADASRARAEGLSHAFADGDAKLYAELLSRARGPRGRRGRHLPAAQPPPRRRRRRARRGEARPRGEAPLPLARGGAGDRRGGRGLEHALHERPQPALLAAAGRGAPTPPRRGTRAGLRRPLDRGRENLRVQDAAALPRRTCPRARAPGPGGSTRPARAAASFSTPAGTRPIASSPSPTRGRSR